jgi:HSP20 family protein
MANIIRREERFPARPWAGGYFDPFRLVRDLMRFDPFRELEPFQHEEAGMWYPSFDVKETGDGLVIKADLPGVKDKDVSVTLTGNRLTVSGKREVEERKENERYHAYERSYGSFTRTFTLPDDVDADKIHADLKDGVLSLLLPRHPDVKTKQIPIKSSSTK